MPIGGRAELDGEDTEPRFSVIKGRMELPGESAAGSRQSSMTALPQYSPRGESRPLSAPVGNARALGSADGAETMRYKFSRLSAVELPVPTEEARRNR
jgi:hypothetical protein